MSNLAKSESLDADLLLQLAEQFNVNLEPETSSSGNGGGRIYTNFTSILPNEAGEGGIRILTSGWMDNGAAAQFVWSLPGQREYMEEFEEFANINWITGYIVHAEIQSSQTQYDPETRTYKSKCSVVGYRDSSGQYVKGLPGYSPLRSMYDGWDKAANKPAYTQPSPMVTELGLLGSKGMACADCIRCGESTFEGVDESGNSKVGECTPRGRLFIYVTEVGRVKKVPPKTPGAEPEIKVTTKTIRELLGVSGVLLQINLPTATGLRGNYDKNNPANNVTGYSSYLMQLKIQNKGRSASLANPQMYLTQISIKEPPAGKKSPKNMLHFEVAGAPNVELFKDARTAWTEVNPHKEVEILDPSRFQGNLEKIVENGGAISVGASVVEPANALRSAAVIEEEDSPF